MVEGKLEFSLFRRPSKHMEYYHLFEPKLIEKTPSFGQVQHQGKFTIDSAWDLLRHRQPINQTYRLLWFKGTCSPSLLYSLAGLARKGQFGVGSAPRHGIQWPNIKWGDLIQWSTSNISCKKKVSHMIARLTLSATVYYTWFERNNRIFNHVVKSTATLTDKIFQLVRLHLSTMKLSQGLPPDIRAQWGINED
ncbi:hypothetical protein OIU85_022008 [Salix viminalis]|uniref:Reverse transcriptase zinc-binding domain-containing protein n=1 Tax=Salix viminalis TaxID=40686 RepID=A0A9Q0NIK1_SALVM|nr:hypothetical protein OIU85_022008 [Salix viminalis]